MDEAKLSSFRTSFWAILDRAIIGVMGLALVGSSVAALLHGAAIAKQGDPLVFGFWLITMALVLVCAVVVGVPLVAFAAWLVPAKAGRR